MNKIEIKRHIAKTITWRIVGTIDTVILSWILTGDLKIGFAIGGLEVLSKTLLYFLHERVWYRWIKFGIINKSIVTNKKIEVELPKTEIKRVTYSKKTD